MRYSLFGGVRKCHDEQTLARTHPPLHEGDVAPCLDIFIFTIGWSFQTANSPATLLFIHVVSAWGPAHFLTTKTKSLVQRLISTIQTPPGSQPGGTLLQHSSAALLRHCSRRASASPQMTIPLLPHYTAYAPSFPGAPTWGLFKD